LSEGHYRVHIVLVAPNMSQTNPVKPSHFFVCTIRVCADVAKHVSVSSLKFSGII